MTIRVVHCGTGLAGLDALRAIIEDPALELGRAVREHSREGRPGRGRALPATGVVATGELDEVVALGAEDRGRRMSKLARTGGPL
jgi:hypothetical protein